MKTVFLILCGLSLFLKTQAEVVEGYIVWEGLTEKVNIKISNSKKKKGKFSILNMQFKLTIIEVDGSETVYTAEDIDAFGFTTEDSTYHFESVFVEKDYHGLSLTSEYTFMQKLINGKVDLFRFVTQSNGAPAFELFFIKHDNQDLLKAGPIFYKKKLMTYFEDCNYLIQMFELNEIYPMEIERIVNIYNKECGNY